MNFVKNSKSFYVIEKNFVNSLLKIIFYSFAFNIKEKNE